jgi:hypothetical protein
MAAKLYFLLPFSAAALWFLLLLIKRFRHMDLNDHLRSSDRRLLFK